MTTEVLNEIVLPASHSQDRTDLELDLAKLSMIFCQSLDGDRATGESSVDLRISGQF